MHIRGPRYDMNLGISGSNDGSNSDEIEMEDRPLWQATQSPDIDVARHGFGCLVERYWPMLVELAGRLNPRQDAEDVVQTACVQIWIGRATIEIQGTVRAYLCGAVRHGVFNKRRNDLRSLKRQERLTLLADSPFNVGHAMESEEETLDPELVLWIARNLSQLLTPRQWSVIMLRAEGLTYAQIAEELHITSRTVGTHLRRARRRVATFCAKLFDLPRFFSSIRRRGDHAA